MSDPGDQTPAYDTSGNLTGGYTPAGYAFTAAYDGSNRLTSLSYTDGAGILKQTQYIYMGSKLIWTRYYENGVKVKESQYTYDGDRLVQERNGNNPYWGGNTVVAEYIWGLGLPGGIGGLLRLQPGGFTAPTYSPLYDGKGNVTALLNGVGQVAQTYQYDPFGAPKGASGSVNQPMRFSTKPYDDQTGLSYYGYRFYAPALGRWLTRDPIGERGGRNLYAFVRNNPVMLIDPFGLQPYCDRYRTMDEAGEDALDDINSISIAEDREYGGWIYLNPDGTFSYTAPVPGGEGGNSLGPEPSSSVGDYHTHGNYNPNYIDSDHFSNYDLNGPDGNIANGTVGYLGTPSGQFWKFDPNIGYPVPLR